MSNCSGAQKLTAKPNHSVMRADQAAAPANASGIDVSFLQLYLANLQSQKSESPYLDLHHWLTRKCMRTRVRMTSWPSYIP